jgi:hypothetical protein
MKPLLWILACTALWTLRTAFAHSATPTHALRTKDVIAVVGGGNAQARTRGAHWETLLMAAHPGHRLRLLSFAREGDTVFSQLREVIVPSPLQQIANAKATLCMLDFGQGEAYDGLERLERFAGWYPEQPFPEQSIPERRYHLDNPSYGNYDAIMLYGMLREARPRRVIEVGSGFSSAEMLDLN